MRFQVPQFIDIEDKIIGPFTIKQFLMYVAAVMVLIPVYLMSDLSLFLTITIPVMGTAAAFAHMRINGKSLAATIGYAGQFYLQGNLYIWRRTGKVSLLTIKDNRWRENLSIMQDEEEQVSLATIAQTLETEGNVVQAEDIEDPLAEEE